jgi:phage terminase large subunit-like protein
MSNPVVRDTVCKACRAVEFGADLKAKVLERVTDKMAREEVKASNRRTNSRRKYRAKRRSEAAAAAREEDAATAKRRNELEKKETAAVRRQMLRGIAARKAYEAKERAKERKKETKGRKEERNLAEHAHRELARRELTRRKLLYFTRRFEGQKVDATGELIEVERAKGKGYQAGWVHSDICARLERFLDAVRKGHQPRLMLFMPPRHGKSTLASRMFPAWALGQDPTLEIIAASYGSSLPEQFSRSVRGLLRDPEYQAIFPGTRLDPQRENVQGWATSEEGMYIPAGVGSGISGKGADLLIIDDPFKGAEDAESPNAREHVLDWYFSEAYTRLSPNAGVLIILTRWHDADLAGALLTAQEEQEAESREILDATIEELMNEGVDEDGVPQRADHMKRPDLANVRIRAYAEHNERLKDIERWEVVSYPAIAEADEYRMEDGRIVHTERRGARLLRKKGEALHPVRFPIERLRRIRKNLYGRGRQRFWHALYQQKPVPDEGIHFSREDIVAVNIPPAYSRDHWLGLSAWDLAAGQKQQHDWTVGAYGEMSPEGTIYVLNLVRGRFDGAHGIAVEILNDYEQHRPQMIGVERGPLELVVMPSIKKELEDRNKARQYKDRLTPVFATGEHALTPITDPVMRARPLQSVLQQGKMRFAQDLLWMEEMIQELIRFPGAVHDDIVTSLSWLARLFLMHETPQAPSVFKRQKSWRDELKFFTRSKTLGHMGA